MKKLILFSGLPGSGKSTIADAAYLLLKGENYNVKKIDIDDFKRQTKLSTSDSIDPPEVRWSYTKKAVDEAIRLLKEKDHDLIIMDEMFHVREIRERINEVGKKNGIQIQWVYITVSDDVFMKRIKNRKKNHIMTPEESIKVRNDIKKVFYHFCGGNVTIIENDIDGEIPVNKELFI